MKPLFVLVSLLLLIANEVTTHRCMAAKPTDQRVDPALLESSLTLWPEADRRILSSSVVAAATGQEQPYATFDADGTIWSSDATESFIAYLEAKGILTPERLKPEIKVVPFLEGEGVYSYYQRLCKMDKVIGYPFSAQIFAGYSLAELRQHYVEMMKTPGSKVQVWNGSAFVVEFVATPKPFPQQLQLIHVLQKCGVKVYIVTASPEELVRFLACDPACGEGFDLHLPPEQIVGLNLLMRDDKSSSVTSSRLRLNQSPVLFDASNTREYWEQLRLTTFVLPPVTMFSGKVAAITSFIHPTQPPVLAAGDSSSDIPMLFHSIGARVWVEHPYTAPDTFPKAMKAYQQLPNVNRGWVRALWDKEK